MDFIQAVIMGIVEGITEFLPVSSTGHMIIAAKLLKISQSEFVKSFEIAVQSAAILAVAVMYWKVLLTNGKAVAKILAAFIPTAVIGFIFYKLIKQYLIGNEAVVVWSLLVGGVIIIVFEKLWKKQENVHEIQDISYASAALIGVFQSIAVIPGVSRSAATIIGGLALGVSRRAIVEFSFLLAVPTMIAATVLDLAKNVNSFSADQAGVLAVGAAASFIFALLSTKFFLKFIKNHTFIPFGIYRIIAAVLLLFLFL